MVMSCKKYIAIFRSSIVAFNLTNFEKYSKNYVVPCTFCQVKILVNVLTNINFLAYPTRRRQAKSVFDAFRDFQAEASK